VALRRGATLRYNSEFGSVQRLVASLNGIARFDVVKNAEKPMHIDLGEWEAVVKGTLFDIKQNESTGQKELTLYHVKVELINKKDITQILSILPYYKVSVLRSTC
jgi:transmembrane sensor